MSLSVGRLPKLLNKCASSSLAILLAFTGYASIEAAEITISKRSDDDQSIITISGEIVEGDDDKFLALARKAPNSLVSLKSPGGLIEPAMEIGRMVWFNDMGTFVTEGECASACGLIWLAGNPRAISTNGKVGFHAVYTEPSKMMAKESSSGNALVGAYLSSLKLGSKVIEYATEASPRSMKWLNEADAEEIGLEVLFLDREFKAVDDYNAAVQRTVKARGKADRQVVDLYTSASRLGFAGAQNNLGDLYETGNGVNQDIPTAIYWYTRAAERGEPTAYYSLSSVLGKSADPDVLVEALKFAILANTHLPDGSNKAGALELVKDISDRIPPSYRMIALELAKKWVPLYQESSLLSDDPTPKTSQ